MKAFPSMVTNDKFCVTILAALYKMPIGISEKYPLHYTVFYSLHKEKVITDEEYKLCKDTPTVIIL